MNDTPSTVQVSGHRPPASDLQPIVLILALALRIRAGFGEVYQSASNIIVWSRAQIRRQHAQSTAVLAIDDELEQAAERLAQKLPTFKRALANDQPAVRRECLAELGSYLRAAQITHARTETIAPAIAPVCPEHLLQD
jgi:hypothetical protein